MAVFMVSGDYAVLKPAGSDLRFYYGYEETTGGEDEDGQFDASLGDWCFTVCEGKRELLRVPWRELPGAESQWEVSECLLAGLALWVSNLARLRAACAAVKAQRGEGEGLEAAMDELFAAVEEVAP